MKAILLIDISFKISNKFTIFFRKGTQILVIEDLAFIGDYRFTIEPHEFCKIVI